MKVPNPDQYFNISEHWLAWDGVASNKHQGWKLHVSGTQQTAQQIVTLIVPILQAEKLAHKVLSNLAEFNTHDETQRGKYLVIYPDSPIKSFEAVFLVDRELIRHKNLYEDHIAIANERKVGRTCVYSRYGAYVGNDLIAPDGSKCADSRAVVKPGWADDIWIHYNQFADPATASRSLMVIDTGLFQDYPKYRLR